MADTFRSLGYAPTQGPLPRQPGRLVRGHRRAGPGRGDRSGTRAPRRVRRAARRPVEQRGRPVRAGRPVGQDQPGRGRGRRASSWRSTGPRSERVADVTDRATHRRLRLGGRRADGPSRDRAAAAARVDGLPRRQRRARRTARGPTTRSSRFTGQALDRLVERDVKAIVIACNTSTAVALADVRRRYPLPILGVIRPGAAAAALATRVRRVGVIATPATVRSHAYFQAIKEENPAVEVYEHATPAFVPMVEAGELAGPERRGGRRASPSPRCSGSATCPGEFIFPLPPSARIDTLLLGCTHYPLLRPVIEARRRGGGRRRRLGHRHGGGPRRRCSTTNGLETGRPRPGGPGPDGGRCPPPADDRRCGRLPCPRRAALRSRVRRRRDGRVREAVA